jgi:hypothetical protein
MNDELVQIWSTGDATIAELTRARLEGEGIDVLVKSSMGGSSAYPVGPSYLFVKADQEQEARASSRRSRRASSPWMKTTTSASASSTAAPCGPS